MVNFYNTLSVILTVNCGEFHQGLSSEKKLILNCGEFMQHTLSNYDGKLH